MPGINLTLSGRRYTIWYRGKTRHVCSSKFTPEQAVEIWLRLKTQIDADEAPRARLAGLSTPVVTIANLYLDDREDDRDAGRITAMTWLELRDQIQQFVSFAGRLAVRDLTPEVFGRYARSLAGFAPRTQQKRIGAVRAMFGHAADQGWIPLPVYGRGFKAAKIIDEPVDVLTPAECRKLIDASRGATVLHAVVMLGLNTGLRSIDLARVERANIAGDWLTLRTSKTKTLVRVPLWPETVAAIAGLPDDGLLLRTRTGGAIVTFGESRKSNVGRWFAKLLVECGLKKPGRNIHVLRRTMRSLAGGAKDEAAADVLVGHRLPGMRAVYHSVDDERLRAVAFHVRASVFVFHDTH